MDSELDLVTDTNDFRAGHDAARNARPDQFAESEDGDEFEDGPNDEATDTTASPLPPHLKEISSLAAWTVSTHKPGCGVAALRHTSTAQFWQSDGPQPHYLNIHFFKMVSIAYMRVFLDFEQDESYTPTKLQFMAGTGHHDLQDVCTMSYKEPKGWLEVDLSNAGGPNPFEDGDLEDEEQPGSRPGRRNPPPGHGPTLRCRLVQLRILENHQNGKDTHLRGLQIFAIDESAVRLRRSRKVSTKIEPLQSSPSKRVASQALSDTIVDPFTQPRERGHEAGDHLPIWTPLHAAIPKENPGPDSISSPPIASETTATQVDTQGTPRRLGRKKRKSVPMVGLREPEWMGEPSLR